ncbi:twin-arginine translocation signal domain-containing protein, partial [Candidatus Micrarchaeota archaeon]|nr:twin-arginine translocation signal domain-containing protein [Candidatus Micrarchaeota archaeon]
MDLSRREFMGATAVLGGGLALSALGVDFGPVKAYADEAKITRLKVARQTTSICPYCAVGCGLICATDKKEGKVINIEGDPDHPINLGT